MAATPQSVGTARRSVAQFAHELGANESVLGMVRLAITEAVTNVVRHAYGTEQGPVELLATSDGEAFMVVVRDNGSGMSVGPSRDGLGVGLRLIAEVTRTCDITSSPHDGTSLHMSFPLERAL